MRTSLQTDIDLTDLTTRVNVLDGANLATGQTGLVPALQRAMAGDKSDLEQVCGVIESTIAAMKRDIDLLKASVAALTNSH